MDLFEEYWPVTAQTKFHYILPTTYSIPVLSCFYNVIVQNYF